MVQTCCGSALAGAIFVSALCMGANGSIVAGPAPMWGLNAANTNVSAYMGVVSNPFIRWQVQRANASAIDTPALTLDAQGILYSPNRQQLLATTGLVASPQIPSLRDSTVAIDDSGNRYFFWGGRLQSYAPDGTLRWNGPNTAASDGNGVKIGPDGTIFSCANQVLYAHRSDGTLKWSRPGYDSQSQPPVIDQHGNVYLGTTNGDWVISYDSLGTERWRVHTLTTDRNGFTALALGPDGNLYCSEGYGVNVVVRNAGTGATIRQQSNIYAGIQAISDTGVLYSASYHQVTATTLTGGLIWEAALPQDVFMSHLVADAAGRVYCTSESGIVFAFSNTGTQLWTMAIPGGGSQSLTPIIGTDGTLYVQGSGYLIAIAPAPGSAAALCLAAGMALRRRRLA